MAKTNDFALNERDIFDRLNAGESIQLNDPEFQKIHEAVKRTKKLRVELNNASDPNEIRVKPGEITGTVIDDSTTIFTPFYINFGRFITLGKIFRQIQFLVVCLQKLLLQLNKIV